MHCPTVRVLREASGCPLSPYSQKRLRRRDREQEEEKVGGKVMSFLSYKILRSTCLGFSKELQVVITSDVLQEGLTLAPMDLTVFLATAEKRTDCTSNTTSSTLP